MIYVAITNDVNKYYITWAKTTPINVNHPLLGTSCINDYVESIPSEIDENKIYFYKLKERTEQVTNTRIIYDENSEPVIDEITGLPKTEIYYTDKIVKYWEYDETAYNTWKAQEDAKPVEPTTEEQITNLENENIASLMAITELYEMLIGGL